MHVRYAGGLFRDAPCVTIINDFQSICCYWITPFNNLLLAERMNQFPEFINLFARCHFNARRRMGTVGKKMWKKEKFDFIYTRTSAAVFYINAKEITAN